LLVGARIEVPPPMLSPDSLVVSSRTLAPWRTHEGKFLFGVFLVSPVFPFSIRIICFLQKSEGKERGEKGGEQWRRAKREGGHKGF